LSFAFALLGGLARANELLGLVAAVSALAIIRGSFQLESSTVFPQDSLSGMGKGPESAPFVPAATAAREDSGVKESQSQNRRTNVACWRLSRTRLAAPGATRVPSRRWQSPECRQQVPINREDLLLFRRVLPGRGVQRNCPLLLLMGKNSFSVRVSANKIFLMRISRRNS